jgi:amino acid transporter
MAVPDSTTAPPGLRKVLGTRDVFITGVALVVASTTLVSDFQGYFLLGGTFAMAIIMAFVINLLLGLSAAELSVSFPRAGAIYEYGRDVFRGNLGRLVGLFLGLSFVGMFVLVGPSEASAGGFGLQALFNESDGLNWFILIMAVAAVIPNILGIHIAAWVNVVLVALMLGIRWIFGLAGFFGIGDQGSWSSDNLDVGGPGVWDWFGSSGLMAGGLVLAFWTFVGIEFVCSITEEVREPRRSMPRGIILGLIFILFTSWLMGLGVAGTTPASGGTWAEIGLGPLGCDGSCPQIAVGEEFYGGTGRAMMAIASIAATLGSLVVAFAAIPRIIFGIARNGDFFGPQLSRGFAYVHPRWRTPVVAIVFFATIATVLSLFSSDVVDWIFSGAYVWILMYVAFHILDFADRVLRPHLTDRLFPRWFTVFPVIGVLVSIVALHYAFAGVHDEYYWRALIVLGVAAVATLIAFFMPGRPEEEVVVEAAPETV